MNRNTRAFNAIFFNELRETRYYPLAVVGVLLAAGILFIHWPYELRGSGASGILAVADVLTRQYAGYWGRYALFSVFILATLLPAGMFARERKTKEIACSERFAVSLQTVFLAKFSAAFVLTALVAVGFVLTGFCFDLSHGMKPFSALTEFTRQFDPHEFAYWKAIALSPLELLIWSAFWATALRRESLVVAASLLSTYAVWRLVGWIASVGEPTPSLAAAVAWRPRPDLSVASVGGIASVESAFYAALRFGALLLPIAGIVRVFRRDGAQTTLGNGLTGLDFRFKTFLTKRRRKIASAVSESVPVDRNVSPKRRERSTSVSHRIAELTPRRLRPLTALCVETIKSASLFGRFRGALAIDLFVFNLWFLSLTTNVFQTGAFWAWFLFVVLFGTGAFAGLRRERSVLTSRLPVSPRLYYASQLLTYTALYVAACLPALCGQLLWPETADALRNLSAETSLELSASEKPTLQRSAAEETSLELSASEKPTLQRSAAEETSLELSASRGATKAVLFLGAYHWFVVFCASAIAWTRLGAAILCVLFYSAALCVRVELYGFAGAPPEAIYTLGFIALLVAGLASYLSVAARFKFPRR